jgi:DNA-directed RNA polymerase specialized sigma24 family protein
MIECIKAVKFDNKNKCMNKLHDNITSKRDNCTLLFDLLDELETKEDKDLLMDKFNNMTIEEMAQKRTYSRETVRKKLKKIYSHLRNRSV